MAVNKKHWIKRMFREKNVNDKVSKKKLMSFYLQEGLMQHNQAHVRKALLKVKRIEEIANFEDNDKVLEIGTAKGEILYRLNSKLSVGVDISSLVLKTAKKSSKISYIAADAEYLPFRNALFSKILCIDILEHLKEPKNALIQAKKIIKKNGELIVQVPTIGFMGSLLMDDFHEGHLRHYSKHEIIRELNETGFSVEKIKIYHSVPFGSYIGKFKKIFYALSVLVELLPKNYYPGFGSILIKAKIKNYCS